jgi:hypothetical protein
VRAKFVLATKKSKLLIDFSSCARRALRVGPYDPGEDREANMQRLLVVTFGATFAALTLAAAIAAETVELVSVWNPTGALPDGCTPGLTGGGGPVKWVIIDSEPDGARGVAETSADPTDYRFPLCIIDGRAFASLANVDVSVRFRSVAGKVNQAGGIAVRVKDALNYYVVRANALEDNVRLYAVIDGDRRQFAGTGVKVATNQWHTLRLRATGDRFAVFFDGANLFEATDKRIAEPGRVALWSKADSVTEFVDLVIEPLP